MSLAKDALWFREESNVFLCGFNPEFIERVLPEAWHITPAKMAGDCEVKKGHPILAVETNDSLFSIPAPFHGFHIDVSPLALNFPDRIKKDTIVVQAKREKQVKAEAPRATGNVNWYAADVAAALNQTQVQVQMNIPPAVVNAEPEPSYTVNQLRVNRYIPTTFRGIQVFRRALHDRASEAALAHVYLFHYLDDRDRTTIIDAMNRNWSQATVREVLSQSLSGIGQLYTALNLIKDHARYPEAAEILNR